MTLKDFLEAVKDIPLETKIDKWNTNYGWTELREVKFEECEDRTKVISLY